MGGRIIRPVRLACVLLAAMGQALATGPAQPVRWYSTQQVEQGRELYVQHCASCHGSQGEGEPGWQERDPVTGFYPAPPLDANGHAAEHPKTQMLATLDRGGGPAGGTMPSFVDVLDEAQKEAVIAYVQSLWSDEIYARWLEIEAGRAQAGGDSSAHRH